jgi:hypothetical protein
MLVCFSVAAREPALRFLKELLALPIPETAMRRLVRKLCGGRLMDLLDHAFASSTESSTQCGVLDVLSALQSVSSDRFYEHVFSADGQLVPSMINRLTDSSEVCDLLLSFSMFLQFSDVLCVIFSLRLPWIIRSSFCSS